MSCGMTASCALPPGDPFSDAYVIDFEDEYSPVTKEEVLERTISKKAIVTVPILDTLPHLEPWSPQSTLSIPSSSSSPTQSSFSPIHWTNEDLMYLISCLLPDLAVTSTLVFSPPLSDLHDQQSHVPIHLRLYQKTAPTQPSPACFSKHAPIGTGRPITSLLIAESDKTCNSPASARKSLALNLLASNPAYAYSMLDKYNVLSALYAQSTPSLLALQRGMIEMLGVSDAEWEERYAQLVGQVDGACTVEARIEVFLLGVGRREVDEWVCVVQGAGEMDGAERRELAGVWGDVGGFLAGALGMGLGAWL